MIADEQSTLMATAAMYMGSNNDLSSQISQKLGILGYYANSVSSMMSVIKKSQRLFDVTSIVHYQNKNEYDKGQNDEKVQAPDFDKEKKFHKRS